MKMIFGRSMHKLTNRMKFFTHIYFIQNVFLEAKLLHHVFLEAKLLHHTIQVMHHNKLKKNKGTIVVQSNFSGKK